MKQIQYIFLVLFLATACTSSRPAAVDRAGAPNLVTQENGDDEEHELIIIDPGYQTWASVNKRPINYHSPQYYEQWNQRYVSAWNERVNQQGMYRNSNYPFQERINYDPNEDYGVELNHELYWYFRYIESLYGRQYNFPNPGGVRSGRF